MSKSIILLGGDITATPNLIAQCRTALSQGALVIAADSGIRHAAPLALNVECWLGDFDSITPQIAHDYRSVPRKTYSPDKDKTDGELAIEQAITLGAASFLLIGAFGGLRTDHALLHKFQALALARRGFDVVLTNGLEEAIPLLPGHHSFELNVGTLFSLIGFTALEGVSIHGAKWPLIDRNVPMGSSLTLSNVATGLVTVSIRSGEALFITGSSGPV